MELVESVLKNVLQSIYHELFVSLTVAMLYMYVYLNYKKCGIRKTIEIWIETYKNDSDFRNIFFLVFYISMILFRTVWLRDMWLNPVSNVLGNWSLWSEDGSVNTEGLENVVLFIPLTGLVLHIFNNWIFKLKQINLVNVVLESIIISFSFSLLLESWQLFFRVGTFQLSDLFFNTLGGVFGGIYFWVVHIIKEKNSKKIKLKE